MQYHKASFIGHERSKKAQLKLFDYTGYAMLTYTVKQDGNSFAPVGEEMLVAKMEKESEAMIFLCDSDGYAKRSEEHTSELQSPCNLVCRLLLEKKKHQ